MIDKSILPAHWEVKKLGEVVKTTSGGTPSRKEAKFYNGTIPWVKSGELNQGLILDTEEKITQEAIINSSAKLFPKGTLLIALYGATIGKLAFLGIEAATNQAVCGIFENDKIDSKYIYYYLYFSKPDLLKQSIGGAQPNISQTILKDLPITLPPLSEQQEIVAKIEELFSELDKGKEQLETTLKQLKVYRQAVLKWAFEGRFTNSEVKDGELPEGWNWVKLGDLMESVRNGYSKKPDSEGPYKILRISSVRPGKVEINDIRFLLSEIGDENSVQENDLLFTRYNGSIDYVGVCGRVPLLKEKLYYPDKLIRCRPLNKAKFHSAYLEYASNSGNAREFVLSRIKTTAGQTGIAGSEIKQIPIPLAPLEEQQLIVQEIESRLSVCDKVEETITKGIQQAETLRQSILKKAFEGKLVTNEHYIHEL
jgi:type I restriction enzyme S subunit